MNRKELLQFVQGISVEAGELLLRYQKKISSLSVSVKEAEGLVSSADIASEKFLIKEIHKKFPEHCFLAEESSSHAIHNPIDNSADLKKAAYCWIIDPLDGTNNFLNRNDYFSISIALYHFGKPLLGLVYRPVSGECFWALKDGGAYLKNLKTESRASKLYIESNSKKLKDCLLITGFSSEKGKVFSDEFVRFKKILSCSRGVRRYGGAALDLCYVAQGIFDGFWEIKLAPWDVAAAALICLEAGVRVGNFSGKAFDPFHETILAARNPMFREFIRQL